MRGSVENLRKNPPACEGVDYSEINNFQNDTPLSQCCNTSSLHALSQNKAQFWLFLFVNYTRLKLWQAMLQKKPSILFQLYFQG